MSGFTPSLSQLPAAVDLAGTDDELSTLLGSLRRNVLEAPAEAWEPAVRDAAKTVSAALADRLDPKRHGEAQPEASARHRAR